MEYQDFKKLNKISSGHYSTEKRFKSDLGDVYKLVLEYTKNINVSFRERLYSYFKKDTSEKKCKCGNQLKFYSIERGYSVYCSVTCSNKGNVDLIKKIKLERYGNENYNNTELFKSSIKKKIENDNNEIKAKREKTKLEKYGNKNFLNIEKAQQTKKINLIKSVNSEIKDFNVTVSDIMEFGSYEIYCEKCKKTSTVLNSRFNIRIRNNTDPCIVCNNITSGTSSDEKEIADFIESLGLEIIRNDRKILQGTEIDVYIPSMKIGIEFNGLYWHSEIRTPANYHSEKKEKAASLGINLIHIWEDDWELKNNIVKSRLLNLLKKSPIKIYARKCEIGMVDYKKTTDFINANHIQGNCPHSHSVGLYFDKELVSVCTFGSRKISGSSGNELLRYCNKLNHNIPGAFSRMLKFYIQNINPESIITFADKSWTGNSDNVYSMNGFKLVSETKPNYWYIVNKKRKHRYNYRKSELIKDGFDSSLTEKQIMLDRGILRIYDCGQYKYILKLH
jgi:hypothetical protein